MPTSPGSSLGPGEITRLLRAWNDGDEAARDRLIPLVYQQLRQRAAAHLRRERREHTLRPTELVHEAYLRLVEQNAAWQNREQLYGVASSLMRRILVDHARRRGAAKRGIRVTLVEGLAVSSSLDPDLLDLDAALEELAAFDERQARLVELRFFGGLSTAESALVLGISRATANRDWALAKAWLFRRLGRKRRGGAAGTR